MSRTAVILLAAGSGQRMRAAVEDKILQPLAGKSVFHYSARAFMASGVADLFVVVYRDRRQMLELAAQAPTPAILVRGGRTRRDSVAHALAELPADIDTVFIHDSARPLVRPEHLVALLKIVRREQAVVLAHRVTDTVKVHRAEGLLKTLERDKLWAAETPQVFARELIERAYRKALANGREITDDASAVELLGHPVALLENQHPNPKLTVPEDLAWFEFLLQSAEEAEP